MKNTTKVILLATITILFAACQKERTASGSKVTYHKTIGEGYIYDAANNIPIKDAKNVVITACNGAMSTVTDTFATDKNGCYQIRFIKKAYTGLLGSWYEAVKYTLKVPRDLIPPPLP
jgi:hypothetical protein